MKIKNVEIEFDFFDADNVELFENELKKVQEKCEKKKKVQMSMSEAIKEECKIVDEFFDAVFGDGTAQKIFGGKMNLAEHIKAYEDIINAKIAQEKDLQTTFEKYQPNRAQRRTKRK